MTQSRPFSFAVVGVLCLLLSSFPLYSLCACPLTVYLCVLPRQLPRPFPGQQQRPHA